jgi:hypothetical protein
MSQAVKHEKTEAHKQRMRAIQNQPTISQVTARKIIEKKMVQESEIYLFARQITYQSLFTKMYPESKITAHLNCGRTKCTNIIKKNQIMNE